MENRLDGWMDKIDGKDKSSTGWTCGQVERVVVAKQMGYRALLFW